MYITSDKDLIISYCKTDSDEFSSEGNAIFNTVSNILSGKCLANIRASNSFSITKEYNYRDDFPSGGCNLKKRNLQHKPDKYGIILSFFTDKKEN